MKPKKVRRFDTSQQIEDEIDLARKHIDHKLAVAQAYDIEADNLFKVGHPFSEDAVFKREQAKVLRRQAYRIETKRIPKLREKLAEFKTELLPGVITDGDRSLPRKLK